MSRREALGHLSRIVGGSAAAVAFLAACSSDGGSKGAGGTATSAPSDGAHRTRGG